jgi:hypothetical protein
LLNISEIAKGYTQEYSTALMALHAFSGCDTTSAFKGLGKVKPLKTLLKMPKFVPVLAKLGETWDVSNELIEDLEAFTCAIYGRARASNVNELRFSKINELCAKDECITPSNNLDMGSLPPCRKSLEQHIRRANCQVGFWKRAHIAVFHTPDPTAGHGWTMLDGHLEPLWYDGELLPQQLADIAEGIIDNS